MQSTVEAGPKVSRHGKACINCARAKVKCVEQSIGACERCHRLNKDCQPITRVQRRKPAKKTTAAKTAELEEKLDGLVSLLAAATQQQLTPPESTAPYQSTSSEISSNSQAFQCQIGTNPPLDAIKSLQNAAAIQLNLPANSPYRILSTTSSLPAPGLPGNPGSSSIPQGTIPSVSLIPPELELSPAEEEAALQSFRSYSKKYFPFIQIPEQTTAQKFREESPFLSLTIMMAMAKSTQRQMSLAIHIRQLIGKKLLVDGERDLDLLFGLMTFVGWGQCHYQQRPTWTTLILLAMGIVYDLGLNKTPPKESPHLLLNYDAQGCPKPFIPPAGTLQERRALLCCFSVSSSFSMFVQKLDTLRWTPYAEESLAILTKNHASIEDLLLVQIVRLNLIQERVKEAPWFDTASSGNAAFKAPSSFYLNALKAEMKSFRVQIPPELKNNETLLMHLYNTEVTIHEVGLSKEPTFDMDDFSRLDSLCACLQAAKAWFEIYLNIPGSEYPGFSFPIYTHLAHCIVALYRLSVFEHTNWDIGMVRQELDLSAVLEKVVKMFESVKEASGLDTEDCDSNFETNNIMVYSTMGKRIGQIKTWWNAKMAAENSANNVVNNSMGAGEVTDTMGTNPFAVEPIQDFWPGDDTWWQDVFGPWNIQVDPMTM